MISEDLDEYDKKSKMYEMRPELRMQKIDLETIYPQAEKDLEGERLKHLCEIQAGQKS